MITLTHDQIEPLIDWTAATDAIRQAYIDASAGRVNLPPVGHITFPETGGDCHIKYGHVTGTTSFVIKVATGFPRNADAGLPNGNGLVLVLSSETGAAQAMLHDHMLLTDIRTALGGVVATQSLARPDARKLLVIGTSVQAQWQVRTHAREIPGLSEITMWGRTPAKILAAADVLAPFAQVKPTQDLRSAVENADIIVTATGATRALIRSEWVRPGTHITAVGADAPGKQELDPALVAKSDLITVDSISQCSDHGEVSHAIKAGHLRVDQLVELGKVLEGSAAGRPSDQAITLTDLTGIAAQDIAIATAVLNAHQDQRPR